MDQSGYKNAQEANTSCMAEWPGSQLAIVPSWSHNSLVASLLGPSFFSADVWLGIYSWATYDYFFR